MATALACTLLAMTCLDILYSHAIARHPMLNMPQGRHYDHLVIGDSRVSSLLEKTLDTSAGGHWLVVAHYGGNIDDIRIALRQFFDYGNTADTLWLSVDMRLFGNTGLNYEWLYYAYDTRRSRYLNPRFPFVTYARNNARVDMRRVVEDLRRPIDTSRMESRDFSIVQWYRPNSDQKRDYTAQTFRRGALDSIRTTAVEHRVKEVGLFTAPLSPEYVGYQSRPNDYKQEVRSLGLRYIDFSSSFSDTLHFADLVHLKRRHYRDFTLAFADSVRKR
jgi:hypothetical protein